MDDLVKWLRAQFDRDERLARAASEYAEAVWRLDEDGETVLWWPPEPRLAEKEREHGLRVVSDRWRGQTIDPGGARIAPHVVEHDPARVLREIDAKRRLIELHHAEWIDTGDADGNDRAGYFCAECDVTPFPCRTLRLLVLPYADRPGYRVDWRP